MAIRRRQLLLGLLTDGAGLRWLPPAFRPRPSSGSTSAPAPTRPSSFSPPAEKAAWSSPMPPRRLHTCVIRLPAPRTMGQSHAASPGDEAGLERADRDEEAGALPRRLDPAAGLLHLACMPHDQTSSSSTSWHGTTILAVRKGGKVVIAGDGQVSFGNTVMKSNARKVRRLGSGGNVIAGFAGATADAFTLFERLESKLESHPGQLVRACVELAKDWRTDRYLRRLEAMMAVADKENSLVLTGNGDVLEPEDGLIGIGSGGSFALSAARALIDVEGLEAEDIARKAMSIAAGICIYTNDKLTIESL